MSLRKEYFKKYFLLCIHEVKELIIFISKFKYKANIFSSYCDIRNNFQVIFYSFNPIANA